MAERWDGWLSSIYETIKGILNFHQTMGRDDQAALLGMTRDEYDTYQSNHALKNRRERWGEEEWQKVTGMQERARASAQRFFEKHPELHNRGKPTEPTVTSYTKEILKWNGRNARAMKEVFKANADSSSAEALPEDSPNNSKKTLTSTLNF